MKSPTWQTPCMLLDDGNQMSLTVLRDTPEERTTKDTPAWSQQKYLGQVLLEAHKNFLVPNSERFLFTVCNVSSVCFSSDTACFSSLRLQTLF